MKTPKLPRSIVAATAGMVLAGMVTACTGSGNDSSADTAGVARPSPGGRMVVGTETDWSSLDPADASNLTSVNVLTNIYGTLLYTNDDGDLRPGLALSYEANDDYTVYTVKLRRGVEFHDGTPFTAQAVKVNLDRVRDPATGSPALPLVAGIESVRTRGRYTVVIESSAPNSAIPRSVLAYSPGMIVSPAALRKYGENIDRHPVGAGPFQFQDEVPGSSVRLTRYDNYWRQQRPYLDGVTFKAIDDSQTRYASLNSDVIDVADNLPYEQIRQAESEEDLIVEDMGTLGTQFVHFQLQRPPFNDPRARQAVIMATNPEILNKALYGGMYDTAVESPFPPTHPYYPGKNVPGYPEYNQRQAKALVDEMGGLSFTMSIEATPQYRKLAQALQAQWRKVGIQVSLRTFDQPTLVENSYKHDFEAMLYRWQGQYDPDANTFPFFHSKYATAGVLSRNYGLMSDPAVDRFLEQGRNVDSKAQRQQAYTQLSQRLAELMPRAYLWAANWYRVQSDEAQGLPVVPDGLDYLENAYLASGSGGGE